MWTVGEKVSLVRDYTWWSEYILMRLMTDVANDSYRAEQLARVAAHPQGPMRKIKADENEIFNGS